ncbi:MAG: EpsI family protein [Acidobacteria bacterium]|nr:EpsI family protein [Acidobacteriota bacterium]
MKGVRQFLVVAILIVGTAIFLHSRASPEKLPDRLPLNSFPKEIAGWTSRDVPMSEDTLRVLGAGEFLLRIYQKPEERTYVDFFVAFFPSQRAGDTIHSPQNCLPGSGWEPLESVKFHVRGQQGEDLIVNRYLIARGLDRQVVFYWYQAHGRVVASEYWAKYFLVADAIRMNRTDGALVRVVTPLRRDEKTEDGQQRALSFISLVLPNIEKYIPN